MRMPSLLTKPVWNDSRVLLLMSSCQYHHRKERTDHRLWGRMSTHDENLNIWIMFCTVQEYVWSHLEVKTWAMQAPIQSAHPLSCALCQCLSPENAYLSIIGPIEYAQAPQKLRSKLLGWIIIFCEINGITCASLRMPRVRADLQWLESVENPLIWI